MESVDGKVRARVEERIWKLLSKWKALEMAVENQWGGPDSILKSHKLASDVLSCLFLSKAEVKVEDLENLLHESLLLSFNTEIEDGSIDEVAEQLMNIRDEYLQGNIHIISVQSNNCQPYLLHQKHKEKSTPNSDKKSWPSYML
ncbi:hypothetical protein ABFX02_14G017900 [Erythranthe guttata]